MKAAVVSNQASEHLRDLARKAGMSYDMLARALSVSRRSIGVWLSGEEPSRHNRVRINEFSAIC